MTLITIRPGPVLHVFRDGVEIVSVSLTFGAAMAILKDLAESIMSHNPGSD
jgi:hypothetical protein